MVQIACWRFFLTEDVIFTLYKKLCEIFNFVDMTICVHSVWLTLHLSVKVVNC